MSDPKSSSWTLYPPSIKILLWPANKKPCLHSHLQIPLHLWSHNRILRGGDKGPKEGVEEEMAQEHPWCAHTARKPTTQWKTVILNMVFHRVTAQEIKHLPCESLMIHPVQVSSRSNLSMAANQINHSKFSRKTTIIWWLYFIPQTRIVPPIHNLLPLLKIRFQEHTISSLSQLGIPTTSNLIWILDSGASDHVCPNIKLFSTIHLINPLSVKFPNGTTILAYYSGSVEFSDTLHLHNVLLHLHFFFLQLYAIKISARKTE